MNSITLGKDQYHLNGAMERWCEEHIGNGGWHTLDTPPTIEMKWWMRSMFGNTTFGFHNPKHLSMFILRWS